MLLGLATLMDLAAGTGLAYLAGFPSVLTVLGRFDGAWLAVITGCLVVSFTGYLLAYRGVFAVDGGPRLPPRQLVAVVAAGFAGIVAERGSKLDQYVLEAAGADDAEARARACGLAGMEHGTLAIGGCAMAIAVLAASTSRIPADFTVPWAVLPVPGFLIAFWAAGHYRHRFSQQGGWRRSVRTFLDSICLIRVLFTQPRRWGSAVCGMAVFWAADALAAWAALAAFGFDMNAAAMFVGFATGMVFTRRNGPLAGAGVLTLVLAVSIWASGAPFATAVAGLFVYRIMVLWLPAPVCLATLPVLRQIGQNRTAAAERPQPEPARQRALRRGHR